MFGQAPLYAFLSTGAPPEPRVDSISPAFGEPFVSAPFTLRGSFFSGASSVKIGNDEVASFDVISSSVIQGWTTGAAAAENLDVTVTTPFGTGILEDAYTIAAVDFVWILKTHI